MPCNQSRKEIKMCRPRTYNSNRSGLVITPTDTCYIYINSQKKTIVTKFENHGQMIFKSPYLDKDLQWDTTSDVSFKYSRQF